MKKISIKNLLKEIKIDKNIINHLKIEQGKKDYMLYEDYTNHDIETTFFQGYLYVKPEQVTKILGKPTYSGDRGKTTMEWVVKLKQKPWIGTIYNYNAHRGDTYPLHIGGTDASILDFFDKLFPGKVTNGEEDLSEEEKKGSVKLKKGTSDQEIKKYTDKDIDVELYEEEIVSKGDERLTYLLHRARIIEGRDYKWEDDTIICSSDDDLNDIKAILIDNNYKYNIKGLIIKNIYEK